MAHSCDYPGCAFGPMHRVGYHLVNGQRVTTCSRCGLAPEVHDDTLCAAVAAGAAPRQSWFPAVSPVPGQQQEAVARKLLHEFVTADPNAWDGTDWLSAHNRRECYRVADELLALLAATQDGGQA